MTNANTNPTSPGTDQRQRVLFIGGLGRSGTTLIEKLLNEAPETFAVGETVHLWERGVRDQERCGCGERFADCEHWPEVGRLAFGGWDALDLRRAIDLRWSVDRSRRMPQILGAHRNKPLKDDQLEYLELMRKVLLASAERSGASVLLDSSKHLSTAALLALDPALDVRVLHVVRDPRGVAYSWTKAVARPETDGEMMPTYRPSRTAMRWVTDNRGFDTLAKAGVPTLRLRYEDFLADPAGSLRAIGELAGIDSLCSGDALPFLDTSTDPVGATISTPMHSVAGNPLRFGGAELALKLDDAWRTELDAKARATVTRITRPALGRYGYTA